MNRGKPLAGYQILNTRATHQAKAFTKKIEELGGTSIEIPLIQIRRSYPDIQLKSIFKQLSPDDWIVFTSKNGIQYFFEHLEEEKIELELFSRINIAVVGEKTKKAAEKYSLNVNACPSKYTAEALKNELVPKLKKDSKIVIVRGNLASPTLREGLKELGFAIIDFVAYETRLIVHNEDYLLELIKNKKLDFLTFTSTSTVNSFMTFIKKQKLESFLTDFVYVSIGSVTTETLSSYGIQNVLTPKKFTIDGMIEEMSSFVINGTRRNQT